MSPLGSRSRSIAKTPPDTVTPARWVAFRVVHRTFAEGAFTDRAFAAEADRAGLRDRDRSFAQRLAFGAVQRAGAMEHVIATVGKRPIRKIDLPMLNALRLGMYELLETAGADHSAVDQAVEIVRAATGERAVPFANAVLRRGQADGPAILDRLHPGDVASLAISLSMPQWFVERLHSGFGERGVSALAAQNEPRPEHAIRLNTLHPAAARLELDEPPPPFNELTPEARTTLQPLRELSDQIADGVAVPQSLASMLVCAALDPQPGERVLDMCAAPGNKTTCLAARMRNEGEILACELHESRAGSIAYLATRLRATIITTRTADATSLTPEEIGLFDRVLVDAPCSGTGVLAGRPDARWRREEEALPELVALQQRLLATASRLVRPGGTVVYSTCSLLREENEDVVDHALTSLPGMEPCALPAPFAHLDPGSDTPAHIARTWPHQHPTDGFFLARLRREES
jgi:16S rRNA (cytosine967-C5)-methyltransferase